MSKSKKSKKNPILDFVLSLLVSVAITYLLFSLIRSFFIDGSILDSILAFKDNSQWLFSADRSYQIVFAAVFLLLFSILFFSNGGKSSGYKDASSHGAYGNAKFSYVDDLREDDYIAPKKEGKWSEKDPYKALKSSNGIILGRSNDELVIVPPDSSLDNRNVLVVGSSGSSKGQAFVINNILNNVEETIICTDPKGELFELTSDIKRDQGYKVYQIDFFNFNRARYNPLDYVYSDMDASKIANIISMNSAKDVKQDFFFNTAKDLLTGLIIYAKEEYSNANISKTVKGLFNAIKSSEDFLPELCERIGETHPAYQFLQDASAQTGNTRASILSSFAQQTGAFSLSSVAKMTEKSDFNFYDLQEEKSIVYVKMPIKDNPVPALTATFFDQLIGTLYKIGDQHGGVLKTPTIFLLDEFANIGKINDYDNTLSTCRGYGISILTIVQDLAQLEEKYSKELARTIANNHDTNLFLRTKDIETAKYFEELAGNTTIEFDTRSKSGGSNLLYILGLEERTSSSRSVSQQYQKKPLVSQSELLNMNPSDKCYVFMTGHVIELQKAYQSKIYRGFVTGTEKVVVDGIKRFPYVYPEHREKYIQTFGFKPYIEELNESNIQEQEGQIPGESVDQGGAPEKEIAATNEDGSTTEEVSTNEVEKPLDNVLDDIVSDFFVQLNNKKSEKPEQESVDYSDEDSVLANQSDSEQTIDDDAMLSELEEMKLIEDDVIIASDQNALTELVSAAKITERKRKANDYLNELKDHQSLGDYLKLGEEDSEEVNVESDVNEDANNFEDDMDELPM